MPSITTVEGDFVVGDARFAVIVARFNGYIVESLLQGALDTLRRHGIADDRLTLVRVPGAYEIPMIAQELAAARLHDAIIALGVVIEGATAHFQHVAGQCMNGLSAVSLQHRIPIGLGILTTHTIEQAIERAGTKAGNKGQDAALAALEMVSLVRRLRA